MGNVKLIYTTGNMKMSYFAVQAQDERRYTKDRVSVDLRTKLANDSDVTTLRHYYLWLPSNEEHRNHVTGKVSFIMQNTAFL